MLGKDNFPGRKLEEGEIPSSAAIREVLEETNVRIAPDAIALLKCNQNNDNTLQTFVATVPLAELKQARTRTLIPLVVAP